MRLYKLIRIKHATPPYTSPCSIAKRTLLGASDGGVEWLPTGDGAPRLIELSIPPAAIVGVPVLMLSSGRGFGCDGKGLANPRWRGSVPGPKE
jgi:hypothetical protein